MNDRHHPRALALFRCVLPGVALLAAGAALTACGGSSGASAATSTTGAYNRAAVAACLKKQGLSLPQRRPPGGGPPGIGAGPGTTTAPQNGPPPGLGLGGGGGANNPNRARFQAALRKCGVRFRGGGRFLANNPAARQALARFTACVRKNGYNLPAPNTSGNGPVFNPNQVNRNDPKFVAAARKCQSLLPQRRANGPPGATQ